MLRTRATKQFHVELSFDSLSVQLARLLRMRSTSGESGVAQMKSLSSLSS